MVKKESVSRPKLDDNADALFVFPVPAKRPFYGAWMALNLLASRFRALEDEMLWVPQELDRAGIFDHDWMNTQGADGFDALTEGLDGAMRQREFISFLSRRCEDTLCNVDMALPCNELDKLYEPVLHVLLRNLLADDVFCLFTVIEVTISDHLVVAVQQDVTGNVFAQVAPCLMIQESVLLL